MHARVVFTSEFLIVLTRVINLDTIWEIASCRLSSLVVCIRVCTNH